MVALPLALALAVASAEPRPELRVHLARDGVIAAGAFAMVALATAYREEVAPSGCRWCATDSFDVWARDRLRWGNTDAGRLASNVAVLAVPAGLALTLALSPGVDPPRVQILEDLVLMAQAIGITMLGDRVAKVNAARLRPYAAGNPPSPNSDDWLSFWSGHSSNAFAAATSAATIAKLRGYAHWRWILGLGMAGATATAYFRVAGDRHWTTDVLAGAVWGAAVGVAVPVAHLGESRQAKVVPTSNGVLLSVGF